MTYIDRDTAIRTAIETCVQVAGHGITQIDAVNIANAFEDIPAADVVEVVRCKDCRFNKTTDYEGKNACIKQSAYKNPDDFCSYGERIT